MNTPDGCLIKGGLQSRPIVDRVLDRTEVVGDCWEFQGAATKGYGVVRVSKGKNALAHRIVYEEWCGPIPDGLTIDHLCFNTRCVYPAHMELVTRNENTRRQWASGRLDDRSPRPLQSHCYRGHPYDETNTYVASDGKRFCRACQRIRTRARREREKV